MRDIRRKEKAIDDIERLKEIIQTAKYITLAMCKDNEPYLVSLSHGYNSEQHCLYFHCASEGKKISILKENNTIWGQALLDYGYVQGECDHNYASVHFRGRVIFIEDYEEKKAALINMISKLDETPNIIIDKQLADESFSKVTVGKIEIEYMSGKKAKGLDTSS
ncbi:MAG: pyridoxamine 5'-phosphate oxidase family protein [Candidatus Heimdallarchaeaceae archaeon]